MSENTENETPQYISLGEGKNLEITRVEVVGNLRDNDGNLIGDGNYAINLNAQEVASLGMTNIQSLADKFTENQS